MNYVTVRVVGDPDKDFWVNLAQAECVVTEPDDTIVIRYSSRELRVKDKASIDAVMAVLKRSR